ncbi:MULTISPECIES: hypothetical protein [Methylobacterium]|jgi:hypothetical protein|uniref:Uncharacterized protein n=1 Tax=Methylobacterium isbiliense TaxID=315478 RepID=A0ABQ4SHX8_9HYPH|nr:MULTISPECIES: hypothetical protein [Methylobacterium]MBY0299496.1 hypothetical protein [Methylobacterium sp.]MDN3624372.1 hypothetical protein [Methylobacterium isbiliense]GJE01353.1 hypothetical protein GMJLKIPL_3283 [Methylobacterium isbiliense]
MRRTIRTTFLAPGLFAPAGLAALALLAAAAAAQAASFEFVPAPQADLNRVYRVDRATGEVTSCQYGLQEGTIGSTLCFGPGEGAGPQAPSEYGLVASRHLREAGVFRVNHRTGAMSICYVLDEAVVCTPQASAGATATARPGANVATAQPPRP